MASPLLHIFLWFFHAAKHRLYVHKLITINISLMMTMRKDTCSRPNFFFKLYDEMENLNAKNLFRDICTKFLHGFSELHVVVSSLQILAETSFRFRAWLNCSLLINFSCLVPSQNFELSRETKQKYFLWVLLVSLNASITLYRTPPVGVLKYNFFELQNNSIVLGRFDMKLTLLAHLAALPRAARLIK